MSARQPGLVRFAVPVLLPRVSFEPPGNTQPLLHCSLVGHVLSLVNQPTQCAGPEGRSGRGRPCSVGSTRENVKAALDHSRHALGISSATWP